MQRVKNYMNAYKSYAKAERDKLQAMKDSNVYSQEYIIDQEKKLNQELEAKRQEYLKEMNSVIDSKIASVQKIDTSSIEYQTAVSNIFTKVQLIGRGLTPKLLNEIVEPIIQKKDNSTLEAIRSYIESISDFPGGEPRKRELLEMVPMVINEAEVLEIARTEVNRAFNKNYGNATLEAELSIHYLEQSGVFNL